MNKIAVMIPCYNEELTIEKVISDWKQELPEAVIYVYDNASTDRTAEIALKCGAIVRRESCRGKGNVIRRMFREIDAEAYILVDGDDTYPADHGKEMVSMVLDENVDMVVGDRLSSTYFQINKRPFHDFGNMLVRKSVNFLFHNEIKDIMTGLRAFSYTFVKTFPVLTTQFEIETEMSIHAVDKRMNIQNVVVEYQNRPDGSESKLSTFRDGIKVLRTILGLFMSYRPFLFFGIIATVLVIISTAFFIPVLITYFETGEVPNFPTLIVCCFVYLAAIQAFFSGVILHSVMKQERRNFELLLIQTNRKDRKETETFNHR